MHNERLALLQGRMDLGSEGRQIVSTRMMLDCAIGPVPGRGEVARCLVHITIADPAHSQMLPECLSSFTEHIERICQAAEPIREPDQELQSMLRLNLACRLLERAERAGNLTRSGPDGGVGKGEVGLLCPLS